MASPSLFDASHEEMALSSPARPPTFVDDAAEFTPRRTGNHDDDDGGGGGDEDDCVTKAATQTTTSIALLASPPPPRVLRALPPLPPPPPAQSLFTVPATPPPPLLPSATLLLPAAVVRAYTRLCADVCTLERHTAKSAVFLATFDHAADERRRGDNNGDFSDSDVKDTDTTYSI
jgi:hypothetical protein